MKNNDKLFNYTLSVGFIVLILIFLILIVQISRIVFNDENSISEHVSSTKHLLENIEEVEKSVEKNGEISAKYEENEYFLEKIMNYGENIRDVSYLNVNENKSIISIAFDSQMVKLDSTYYLEVDKVSKFKLGDVVVYMNEGVALGRIVSIEDDEVKVVDIDTKEGIQVLFEDILGKFVVQYDESLEE